jgi:hypothetical protein
MILLLVNICGLTCIHAGHKIANYRWSETRQIITWSNLAHQRFQIDGQGAKSKRSNTMALIRLGLGRKEKKRD